MDQVTVLNTRRRRRSKMRRMMMTISIYRSIFSFVLAHTIIVIIILNIIDFFILLNNSIKSSKINIKIYEN